ncbi:MAG: hypothetical protein P8O06_00240 [Porticoccaceae bacterium]|nr:hypothetical protein [Porticoccaceae bacterium]
MLRFISTLLAEVFGLLIQFLVAFCIGAGLAAFLCWHYDMPLVLSIVGGFFVLGLTLVFSSDDTFFSWKDFQ